jgi:hypothetical protein
MAIGVATQFETMLLRKDVIGEWSVDDPAPDAIRFEREAWRS